MATNLRLGWLGLGREGGAERGISEGEVEREGELCFDFQLKYMLWSAVTSFNNA